MSKRLKIKTSTWYRQVDKEVRDTLESLNIPGTSSTDETVHSNDYVLDENIISVKSDAEELFFPSTSDESDSQISHEVQPISNISNTIDRLKHWAVENQISHKSLGQLLEILGDSGCSQFHSIPRDPRSFLKTPRDIIVRDVSPGHYYHIGIKNSIEQQYTSLRIRPVDTIKISINIDGLPLAKSTSSQVYPILCINNSVESLHNVCLVGIYPGYEKPNSFNDFLKDFVCEARDLIHNGIKIFKTKYHFEISMFLFDAVAKASVLYIKGHAGYNSCTKCDQEGEYVKDRMCFPNLTFKKRTHNDFINQVDKKHHVGESILTEIPNIDLIKDIPLDYMHLVLLGVVKKIVCGLWCFGSPPHKFPFRTIKVISEHLQSLSKFVPSEFARKPRGLKDVKRWKATEFRQFLLYTGPIVLKNVLTKSKYEHFLILSVAIRLLTSEKFCKIETYVNYADSLLNYFVKSTKEIYGLHLITHNFHNLLHLADDVRKFGSLEKFSNFSSENYLQQLLRLIRKADKPLPQIAKRIHELNSNLVLTSTVTESGYKLCSKYSGGILISECSGPEYKIFRNKNFKLSHSAKDGCCILKNGFIVNIKNFAFHKSLNTQIVIGNNFIDKENFFSVPCESSDLGIYFVKTLGPLSYWPVSEICSKLVQFPYRNGFLVMELIHLS